MVRGGVGCLKLNCRKGPSVNGELPVVTEADTTVHRAEVLPVLGHCRLYRLTASPQCPAPSRHSIDICCQSAVGAQHR